jgi:pimeloyl-ACP methyl ester carboxylesterase
MSLVQSGYAPVDQLEVYYEIHGRPLDAGMSPLLLIPGGMMAIETAFSAALLARLSAERPVIAIEQQGHGHTADRPGEATMERMADDAVGVLDHLGIAQAHIAGHSLGGMTCLATAIRHPRRVRSLIPISAGYELEGFLPELVKLQRGLVQEPSPALIPLLPTEADFEAWRAHYQRSAPDPAAFDEVLVKLNTLLATWPGWSPDELRAIEAPALVLVGDNDFIRVEHAAEMAQLIPSAQLAVLPGTTHMDIIGRTEWLGSMIDARLSET